MATKNPNVTFYAKGEVYGQLVTREMEMVESGQLSSPGSMSGAVNTLLQEYFLLVDRLQESDTGSQLLMDVRNTVRVKAEEINKTAEPVARGFLKPKSKSRA